MGKVDNKVAFITGAARGQGRAHALRLAEEGADIIAVDMCKPLASARYNLANSEDLAITARAIEALGRRVGTFEVDVRDDEALRRAFEAGVDEVGPVDIVIANAGVALFAVDEAHEAWQDTIDINLTGAFNTVETVVPSMIERGAGGAIVLISSTAGLRGILGPSRAALGYVASKHGVVGLMRSYANNLAPYSIRVNSVHPSAVDTHMITCSSMSAFLEANPQFVARTTPPMPVGFLETRDVSNAVLFLVSDEGRYVTGTTLSVDGGQNNKN